MNRTTIVNIVKVVLGQALPIAAIFILLGLCHHVKRNAEEPLIKAAREKDVKRVERLLRDGADVNITTEANLAALHIAAQYGPLEIAELLLEHGADVNAKTVYDVTPLHFAAQYSDTKLAKLLLARGARIDAKDSKGLTPLEWIVGRDWASPETIDLLELHEDALWVWHEVVSEEGYDRAVEWLRNDKAFKELKSKRRKRSEEEFQAYVTQLKSLR